MMQSDDLNKLLLGMITFNSDFINGANKSCKITQKADIIKIFYLKL